MDGTKSCSELVPIIISNMFHFLQCSSGKPDTPADASISSALSRTALSFLSFFASVSQESGEGSTL